MDHSQIVNRQGWLFNTLRSLSSRDAHTPLHRPPRLSHTPPHRPPRLSPHTPPRLPHTPPHRPPLLSWPPRLPPPLTRLTSTHVLILPLVYGHVVLLKKIISPYFTVQSVQGRRPALYFSVSLSEGPQTRTKGRRPALYFTVSLSQGPQDRTFCSVIPTTPTRK